MPARLVGVPAGEKALKAQVGMPRDHFSDLRDGLLGDAAAGFIRKRLRAEAELKDNVTAMLFQRREKAFVHIRGINIPFGGAGLGATLQSAFHLRFTDKAIIDVRRNMGRCRK